MSQSENITFRVIEPPEDVKEYVQCLRITQHTRGSIPLQVKTCPSGFPGIVFQIAADGSPPIKEIVTRSHIISGLPHLFAHGLVTEPSSIHFSDSSFYTIQVVFKPYALHAFLGAVNAIGLLWAPEFGAADLENRLCAVGGMDNALYEIEHFLVLRLSSALPLDQLVEEAILLIDDALQDAKLQDILLELNTTERNLQKHFANAVGCTPGQYIRIQRVNKALHLIRSGRYQRLSDVAYAAGYYDQSHFIRDIRAMSWLTPKAITQKVSDFQHDETGVSYL